MPEKAGDPAPPLKSSLATIQKIIDAAGQEFGAKGFDGAKIEHIAKRAGVSKQLIYHYFKSKDELYGEMLTLISRENYRVLSAIDYESLDPVAAIRAYITTIFEQYVANPVAAIVTMDQILHGGAQIRLKRDARQMHEQLMGRVNEALEKGKREGVFSSEVSIEELEFTSIVNVTGCVSSRSMFARLLGREPFIDRGPAFWRDYAASFVLRAIRA